MNASPNQGNSFGSNSVFSQSMKTETRGVLRAVRLMRAYTEISSRTTKYALVVLAESLRNKERG